MTSIQKVAQAFVAGQAAKCGNAHTDGNTYVLYGSTIARKGDDGNTPGNVLADWCGYYGLVTANHLNAIAKALGAKRVSYAQARDKGVKQFHFEI